MSFHVAAYEKNLAVVQAFEPSLLWQWFARISAIAHPSHHEEALATDIVAWAKSQGLAVRRDAVGNVIIKKPASAGYENRATIALQAHLDMVPQANAEVEHDFATDPIRLRINPNDSAWLMATGTTLGADNGIGMASCLAVLADDTLAHPELEVLLTMTEETGMVGVFGLQSGELNATMMINTDTEEIGEVYIGCAGGIDADVRLPVLWQKTAFDTAITIDIKGLRGGHSGLDIDKNRSSAIKILARVLAVLNQQFSGQFAISGLHGGTLRNAIAREATATISLPQTIKSQVVQCIELTLDTIAAEIAKAEPNFVGMVAQTSLPDTSLTPQDSTQVVDLIHALPNGVVRQSDVAADTVETSLSFGQLALDESGLRCVLLIRSLVESGKMAVCDVLSSIARLAGASVCFSGDYVGWNPDENSPITALTVSLYEKILNRKPDIKVIHAGLECGLIKKSHPNLDIVSIGPTIKNAHSPDEMVHIESVAAYWQLLVAILKNAPKKP